MTTNEIVGMGLSQFHGSSDEFELLIAFADGREIGHLVRQAAVTRIAEEFAEHTSPALTAALQHVEPVVVVKPYSDAVDRITVSNILHQWRIGGLYGWCERIRSALVAAPPTPAVVDVPVAWRFRRSRTSDPVAGMHAEQHWEYSLNNPDSFINPSRHELYDIEPLYRGTPVSSEDLEKLDIQQRIHAQRVADIAAPAVVDGTTREECAALIDAMLSEAPWKDQMWARGALMIAARAIRRGRHLTPQEKTQNALDWIEGGEA